VKFFTAYEDKLLGLQILERMCGRFCVKYEELQELLWLVVTFNFRCTEVSHLWWW